MNRVLRSVLHVFSLILLCKSQSGDECTSGLMSVDRMDRLLGNLGSRGTFAGGLQGIFPEVGFTCNGSIRTWVLGAEWVADNVFLTELQIWRPVGRGRVYRLVWSTAIRTVQSNSQLYEYNLSSPLAFQPGDVLGYYQPMASRLRMMFEINGREPQCGYYYSQPVSSTSELDTRQFGPDCQFKTFVDVVTDPPGCGRGFMSVERMRYLLNLDDVSTLVHTDPRQQISPDMKFTCDGVITKLIIGADYWSSNTLNPEFQIWRNVGNETYQKIDGVSISFPTRIAREMYDYAEFSPIQVKSGDVLGIFIPPTSSSIWSESTNSPTQYYLPTGTAETPPQDLIDLQGNGITTASYNPLVSVKFFSLPARVSTSSVKVCPSTSTTSGPCPTTVASQASSDSDPIGVCVGVGVALLVVLGVAAVGVVIAVVLVLKRRRVDGKAVDEMRNGENTMDNPVYTAGISGAAPQTGRREGSLGDHYDVPRRDERGGDVVYDVPPESGEPYSSISQTRPETSSPGVYTELKNPLYEAN